MKTKITAHITRLRILVFCVSLLSVASVTIVGSVEAGYLMQAAGQTPASTQATPTPQTAPGEKTVEQVQKNIQVLNGLPQSQLIPVMNYMGSSLGVKCTFCHVKNGDQWDFVSDAKPEKGSAREMIKMVQGINKGNFKGNPAIGCFTCHRGSEHPARVPQLPIAAPTPFAESAETAPKETPPTADQILAKYTEALGGSAVIEKLKTRSMKGTWVTADGNTLGYEVYQTAPDKLFTILNTPKQGVFERGFDGKTAWEKSSRGVRDLEGTQLFYLKRYPDLFRDIKLQGQFTRISYGGKEKIDGKDVYVLRGIGVDGKGERLYFDAQTGLLVRRITSTTTVVGLIPEQVDYEDYREVDGLKVPFTIRITSIDSFWSSTRKFTEIKLNVPVDETKFNKPPAPPPAASPHP
jgi:photosynthetic reaction center cytochrome c subunit